MSPWDISPRPAIRQTSQSHVKDRSKAAQFDSKKNAQITSVHELGAGVMGETVWAPPLRLIVTYTLTTIGMVRSAFATRAAMYGCNPF